MSHVDVWLCPVGIEFNSGEQNSKKGSSPELLQDEKRDRGIKNVADLKPLCLSLCFSHSIWQKTERLLLFSPSLCVHVLVCCCTVEVSGGALLGSLAQLYLLLDDPSWVVDERVDQTGHCRRRADGKHKKKKKKKRVRFHFKFLLLLGNTQR